MKKHFVSALFLGASLLAGDSSYFVGVKNSLQYAGDERYYDGAEKMSVTVGGDSKRLELTLGAAVEKWDMLNKIFLYGWKNDANKYNEMGVGLGATAGVVVDDFVFSFGGKAGIGEQDSLGEIFNTNGTSLTSYIFNAKTTPSRARFTEDTTTLEIVLLLSSEYKVCDYFSVEVGADYTMTNYSFGYELENGGFVELQGALMDNYNLSLGLNFYF